MCAGGPVVHLFDKERVWTADRYFFLVGRVRGFFQFLSRPPLTPNLGLFVPWCPRVPPRKLSNIQTKITRFSSCCGGSYAIEAAEPAGVSSRRRALVNG